MQYSSRTIVVFTMLGLATGIAGCAVDTNEARRLPELPFEDETIAARARHSYQTADRESFLVAIARYDAFRGDHTIPVGRFLLAQTVLALPDDPSVEKLTLRNFSLNCRGTRLVLPLAECELVATLAFNLKKIPREMTLRHKREMGNIVVAEGGAYQVILSQIKTFLTHAISERIGRAATRL